MAKDEMQERLDRRNALYQRVWLGEKVTCPICRKGALHARGKSYIFCDQPGCRMKVNIDYARE